MRTIFHLLALSALALTSISCHDEEPIESQDPEAPITIRETGYLSCADDDTCDSGVRCQINEREDECVTEPLECDEISCTCLASLCGDLTCVDQRDSITCNEAVSVEFNDCEDKTCGESCVQCDPNDRDCVETEEVKVCNADGECVAGTPNNICEAPVFNDCEDKACGESCVQCDPNDRDCVETEEVKVCNADGECVSGNANNICEAPVFNDCEDKACGESCVRCDPNDRDCVESYEVKVCNAEGECVAGTPNSVCEAPVFNDCEDKACGEACVQCDPNDRDCVETEEAKFCDPEGECVSGTPNDLCEAPVFNDCANKVCGEPCVICDPNDRDCLETAEDKACNEDGVCVANTPNLICDSGPTCDELERTYQASVSDASACRVDADCQVLNGQCGVGVGGCYEAANMTLSQSDLDMIGRQYGEQCMGPVCSCPPPPSGAVCNAGICELRAEPPVDYNPCRGKICGDQCTICAPNDPDCIETDEIKACNGEGRCVPETPNLICDVEVICDELETSYAEAVRSASVCRQDADCQILNGQCGSGLGGCYEFVNQTLSQEDLNALGRRYGTECDGPVCDCPPPPNSVACIEGVCGSR